MAEIKIKNITMMFPAIAEPKAMGDGTPAYGSKHPIKPDSPIVVQIEEAMKQVAKEKWKADWEGVYNLLKEDDKLCLHYKEYKNKKTGKVYAGFEGTYYLSTRHETTQPTAIDRTGAEVLGPNVGYGPAQKRDAERLIYSGCITHCSYDIWAQDNKFGRRINATLRGAMFAGEGERFGGGTTPAGADEFADLAEEADIGDLV